MNRFENKIIIVTGADSRIGAATAKRFLREGASVVLNGHRKHKLEETASALTSERILVDSGDVSDKHYVGGLIERTIARFQRLDVLVNNAVIHFLASCGGTPEEKWDRATAINVTGVFCATRAALPHLLAAKGNIINVSSVGELGGDWYQSFANVSKGVLSNLTGALALELRGHGIRVNAVNPSLTLTEMTDGFTWPKLLMERVLDRMPIRLAATSEEVAAVVAFLASDDASLVNGVNIPVDGDRRHS